MLRLFHFNIKSYIFSKKYNLIIFLFQNLKIICINNCFKSRLAKRLIPRHLNVQTSKAAPRLVMLRSLNVSFCRPELVETLCQKFVGTPALKKRVRRSLAAGPAASAQNLPLRGRALVKHVISARRTIVSGIVTRRRAATARARI